MKFIIATLSLVCAKHCTLCQRCISDFALLRKNFGLLVFFRL